LRKLKTLNPSKQISNILPTILLALGLLTSCGTQESDWTDLPLPPNPIPAKNIDPIVQEVIDAFVLDAEKYEVSIPLFRRLRIAVFDDKRFVGREKTIAECTRFLNSAKNTIVYSEIRIDPKKVRVGTCSFKEAVYHELGHCVLNLDHSNLNNEIMSPTILEEWVCKQDWDRLVENLFKHDSHTRE
jgi:hypothetical protein